MAIHQFSNGIAFLFQICTCTRIWFRSLWRSSNVIWHTLHWLSNAISFLCFFRWTANDDEAVNAASHTSHLNGLMPVWMPTWLLKLLFDANILSQYVHCMSRLRKCVSSCFFRVCGWRKALLQMLHLYGFSPVCVIICLRNNVAKWNAYEQNGHWCSLGEIEWKS